MPEIDTPRLARIGRIVMQPGETRGAIVQPAYHLLCVQSGEAFVRIGRRPELHVPAGHAVLHRPPDLTHRRTIGREPSIQTSVVVSPAALTPDQIAALDAAPQTQPNSVAAERLLSAAVDVCLFLHATDDPSSDTVIVPLAVAALMLYVQEAPPAGWLDSRLHPAVAAARDAIHHRLQEPLSLTDLAEAAGITAEHLVRLFRRHLGTTPARYLTQQRVRAGINLLARTTLPITEVARRTGFHTASHFSRAIRETTGYRPAALRRLAITSSLTDSILIPR